MVAYVISDGRLISKDGLEEYHRIARASIEQYGGRYIAMTQRVSVLEGDWQPNGLTMLEFPDDATAKAWYNSKEYAEALPYARRILDRSMIVVNQVSPLPGARD